VVADVVAEIKNAVTEDVKYLQNLLRINYYIIVVMDLALDSDIYEPIMDEKGNFIDYLPPSSKFKNGLRCACGSRKEHVFDSRQSFSIHSKTKTHIKWLTDLNNNKMNYFSENIKLNETISNQKMIIAKLQRENDECNKLIVHLTKKMELKDTSYIVTDLISFD